jgi:hypothetical protein
MIKDRNIDYRYSRQWIPATSFNTFVGASGASVAGGTAVTTLPTLTQVGALGPVGALFADPNDLLRLTMPTPHAWDLDNDIFFRVLWSDGATTTGSVTWKILWKTFQFQAAPAAADTVLARPIEAQLDTATANVVNATTWGRLAASSIDTNAAFLVLDVEMDADAGNINPIMIGLEVAYLPKLTDGTQNNDNAAPADAA